MAGDDLPDPRGLRELTKLADELLAQAAELRRQWSELAGSVGADLPEPPAAPPAATPPGSADPARLVALDMMLSGRTRDEVGDHLRRTFGEDDVDAILDEVFAEYG